MTQNRSESTNILPVKRKYASVIPTTCTSLADLIHPVVLKINTINIMSTIIKCNKKLEVIYTRSNGDCLSTSFLRKLAIKKAARNIISEDTAIIIQIIAEPLLIIPHANTGSGRSRSVERIFFISKSRRSSS